MFLLCLKKAGTCLHLFPYFSTNKTKYNPSLDKPARLVFRFGFVSESVFDQISTNSELCSTEFELPTLTQIAHSNLFSHLPFSVFTLTRNRSSQ